MGYHRRKRDMWSAMRWHAYSVMSAIPYTDLQKAGIRKPSDLLDFPWERNAPDEADIPTEDVVEETIRMLREMNGGKD